MPVVLLFARCFRQYAQCKLCRRRGFYSAVLGWSSTCPLVCKRQGFGQIVEKTVVPQLQFFAGHRHPDPHGPDYSADHRDSTVAVRIWWSISLVCGSRRFSGASVEETLVLPQLQLLRIPSRFRTCSWTRSLTCLCCATTGAWFPGAENCFSPQLQFIDNVWTSVRLCSDVSRSGRCHRFSSSPDMVDIPICTETVGTWLRCVIRVRIFCFTCVSHRCRWCRSRREFYSQVTRHRDCVVTWRYTHS